MVVTTVPQISTMSLSATKLLLDRKATLKMGGEIHCILAEVFLSLS